MQRGLCAQELDILWIERLRLLKIFQTPLPFALAPPNNGESLQNLAIARRKLLGLFKRGDRRVKVVLAIKVKISLCQTGLAEIRLKLDDLAYSILCRFTQGRNVITDPIMITPRVLACQPRPREREFGIERNRLAEIFDCTKNIGFVDAWTKTVS